MKKLSLLLAFAAIIVVSSSFLFRRSVTKINSSTYSGKDLFTGIFFGKGNVANLLPETKELFGGVQKGGIFSNRELGLFQKVVVDELQASDPKFFDSFKKAVESGDRLQIQAKIFETSKKITAISNNSTKFQQLKKQLLRTDLVGMAASDVCPLVACCAVVTSGAGVYVIAVQCGDKSYSVADLKAKTLIEESLVNSIATTLVA